MNQKITDLLQFYRCFQVDTILFDFASIRREHHALNHVFTMDGTMERRVRITVESS